MEVRVRTNYWALPHAEIDCPACGHSEAWQFKDGHECRSCGHGWGGEPVDGPWLPGRARQRLRWIRRHVEPRRLFLVGTDPEFVRVAAKKGVEVSGFEPGDYSGVCCWTLAHLADPGSVLREAQRQVRPGTLLFVEVADFARKGRPELDSGAGHLFTAESLTATLGRNGWEPTDPVEPSGDVLRVACWARP